MAGDLSLDAVYQQRLDAIRPTATDIAALASAYRHALEPGAAALLAALRIAGVDRPLFSEPAVEAVFSSSQGVFRRIDALAHHAHGGPCATQQPVQRRAQLAGLHVVAPGTVGGVPRRAGRHDRRADHTDVGFLHPEAHRGDAGQAVADLGPEVELQRVADALHARGLQPGLGTPPAVVGQVRVGPLLALDRQGQPLGGGVEVDEAKRGVAGIGQRQDGRADSHRVPSGRNGAQDGAEALVLLGGDLAAAFVADIIHGELQESPHPVLAIIGVHRDI